MKFETVKLKDLTTKVSSGVTPRGGKEAYIENGPIKLIRSQNVYNHRFEENGLVWLSEEQGAKLKNVIVQRNDILLNITGDSVARCTIVTENMLPARVNQHVMIIRTIEEKLDPYFLLAHLTSNSVQNYLLSISQGGGTRAALTKKMVEHLEIPLPNVEIQKRIAENLKSLNEKISTNSSIISKYEDVSQLLFKHWFIDFEFPNEEGQPYQSSGGEMVDSELGRIPVEWDVKAISEISEVMSGGTPKTKVEEYWNGSIPFFTPKDVKGSYYTLTTEKYITEAGLAKCASKLYPKDTVFITARGTVGKIALAAGDMAMNQSCYALKQTHNHQYYLYLQLKQLMRKIIQSSNGAVFNAISVRDFNSYKLAYGPVEVIKEFETTVAPLFDMILNLSKENIKLSETRDILLPKLLSGEIELPVQIDMIET